MAEAKVQTVLDLVDGKTDQEVLLLARTTETAERFEDMCLLMGKVVKKSYPLGVEERNMLSVAYKNVVGQRRAAWRLLKQESANKDTDALQNYQKTVEAELDKKCHEVLDLLKNHLLLKESERKALVETDTSNFDQDQKKAHTEKIETQVFYLKMSGDYYRYLAEFKETDEVKAAAEKAYETALKLAQNLAPTHPTRLGLALNASVCHWEILKKPNKACELAKQAFDDAIQKLDSLSDSTYKDSTLIMQLLRDNLTIWTTEDESNKNATNAAERED